MRAKPVRIFGVWCGWIDEGLEGEAAGRSSLASSSSTAATHTAEGTAAAGLEVETTASTTAAAHATASTAHAAEHLHD